MAGGSNGYRAGLVRRQLTPGLISSLPGTAGLPPSISFWTSYPESEPDVDDDGGHRFPSTLLLTNVVDRLLGKGRLM
jgi:hypothetical protein